MPEVTPFDYAAIETILSAKAREVTGFTRHDGTRADVGPGTEFVTPHGKRLGLFPPDVPTDVFISSDTKSTLHFTGQPTARYGPGWIAISDTADTGATRTVALADDGRIKLEESGPPPGAIKRANTPPADRGQSDPAASTGKQEATDTNGQPVIEFAGKLFRDAKSFPAELPTRAWLPVSRSGIRTDGQLVRYNAYVNDPELAQTAIPLINNNELTRGTVVWVRGYVDQEPPEIENPKRQRVDMRVLGYRLGEKEPPRG